MSYNGSGVYTLPGAALANGNIVSATENNQFRNDVAAALNVAWTRDGQAPATANIPMGTFKFTGLGAGTGNGDSVRFEQLPSATNKLDLTTSVTGTLPVGNGGIGVATLTGIAKGNGTSAFSAATAGTDYLAPPSGTAILKANSGGALANATAGTDYLAPAAIGTTVQAYAAELQGATQGGFNGMKNRIINGAMMIDQRNAGASGTAAAYTVDRFNYVASQASKGTWQQNAGSVTPPAGFSNYLGFTSSSAYAVLAGDYFAFTQRIEGLNFADMAWGTASAASVTLSFKVYSSLTGTFGGALYNSTPRSYPFSYTISSANTWTTVNITIPGDTSGTYATNNTTAVQVLFGLGVGSTYSGTAGSWSGSTYFSATGATSVVGTNGATFYITGVQLEKGSTATSFDYRPYGTDLALCQRYFFQTTLAMSMPAKADTTYYPVIRLPVTMRTTPTLNAGATFAANNGSNGVPAISTGVTGIAASADGVWVYNSSNNWTTGTGNYISLTGGFSAEL